jgi:phosphomannomutase/phosphoglucomutase
LAISKTIFRQYDVRGVVGKDLTEEVALGLGMGFAAYLASRGLHGAVAVGRDNRPSGEMLREALVRGLTHCGYDVIDVGVVPTPLLYWALHHEPVVAGIQITGSHNPPEYNGFKMCVGHGSLHGAEIQKLYDLVIGHTFPSGVGSVLGARVIDRYVKDMVERVGPIARPNGKPLRVVYDCGNGAGALVAPQLMKALGVDGIGLFTESDGTFPNHHPDPTVPENLADCINAVREHKADFGVAFDGDADRIGLVDGNGEIIWGDHILILYARDVLKRSGKNEPIIFDVKCSQALPDAIRAAGGEPIMWMTGHSLIKDKMKSTHAPIAGEMSGHMFFTEGFYGHDDAMYAAARLMRIVAESGKSVTELLADVPKFVSTPELRVDCDDDKKFGIMSAASAHFKSLYDVVDVDGVRIQYGDGWGLVRASNTQPVLVMRFEARTPERLAQFRGEMEGWLREQGVDPTAGAGH